MMWRGSKYLVQDPGLPGLCSSSDTSPRLTAVWSDHEFAARCSVINSLDMLPKGLGGAKNVSYICIRIASNRFQMFHNMHRLQLGQLMTKKFFHQYFCHPLLPPCWMNLPCSLLTTTTGPAEDLETVVNVRNYLQLGHCLNWPETIQASSKCHFVVAPAEPRPAQQPAPFAEWSLGAF